MDRKRWQVLKSRRDLLHRTARKRKREGTLQHLREMPERLKGLAPTPKPAPKIMPEIKIVEKPGVFRRLFRRVTGT